MGASRCCFAEQGALTTGALAGVFRKNGETETMDKSEKAALS